MAKPEELRLSQVYGPGNILWEALPRGERVTSWDRAHLEDHLAQLNEIAREFLERARVQPETELQHLKTLFYHQLQALIFQVELKVSDTAVQYRSLQAHHRHSQAEIQIVAQHTSLVRWLLQQPEWADHARGLDVDAELPNKHYTAALPEYLAINGSQSAQLTTPREFSFEVLSALWVIPALPSAGNR